MIVYSLVIAHGGLDMFVKFHVSYGRYLFDQS